MADINKNTPLWLFSLANINKDNPQWPFSLVVAFLSFPVCWGPKTRSRPNLGAYVAAKMIAEELAASILEAALLDHAEAVDAAVHPVVYYVDLYQREVLF